MKLKKCKNCGDNYDCTQHGIDGYCHEECRKDHLDYAGFYKWYKLLLRHDDVCFERDILRDCKNKLWNSWCEYESKWIQKS